MHKELKNRVKKISNPIKKHLTDLNRDVKKRNKNDQEISHKCSASLAIHSLRSKFNVHSLLLLHCVKLKNNVPPGPNAMRKQEGKAGVPSTGDEHSPWLLTDGLSHLLLLSP